MSSNTFEKSKRLLKPGDFKPVFDDAPIRASHPNLLILSRPNGDRDGRLGLIIAKKNVRLAVERNRIKRLIRESFRHHPQHLYGLDVIVLARRGLADLGNKQLLTLLQKQWQRLARKKADSEQGEKP